MNVERTVHHMEPCRHHVKTMLPTLWFDQLPYCRVLRLPGSDITCQVASAEMHPEGSVQHIGPYALSEEDIQTIFSGC